MDLRTAAKLESTGQMLNSAGKVSKPKRVRFAGMDVDGAGLTLNPDWMGQLAPKFHDRPLTMLSIPGTHDSLAIETDMRTDKEFSPYNPDMITSIEEFPSYPLFNNFRSQLKTVWKSWVAKQGLSLTQQLRLGVRFLDVRVAKSNGIIYGEHCLFTRPVKEYLTELANFLKEHPKEIVVLYFQQVNNLTEEDKEELMVTFNNLMGSFACPRSRVDLLTLKTLWEFNYQIILLFRENEMDCITDHAFSRFIWSDDIIVNLWPNKSQPSQLQKYLVTHYFPREPAKFRVIQGVINPSMDMVFGNYKYKSCRELCAKELNIMVRQWVRGKDALNVILVDYAEYGDVINAVVKLNT